jgi:hypothetical protein
MIRVDIEATEGLLRVHLKERGQEVRTETFERKRLMMCYLRGLKAANVVGAGDFRLGTYPEWTQPWRVLPELTEQELAA